jgi:hypothetical protein
MNYNKNIIQLLALCAIVELTVSCTMTQWRIGRATAELEEVARSQKDWGKIAVSELDFAPNTNQFSINYNEDVSNYIQAARSNVSGDASSTVQSSLYLGALLQGMFAPPIAAGSPGNATNLPSQIIIPNQAQTAVNNFPAPASSPGPNPTADERDAVEKGINDKLAEMFLKLMANPNANSNQEAIVFGVMQATCQPGEFTRSGYLAELEVSLKYARRTIRQEYTTTTNYGLEIQAALDNQTGQAILLTNTTPLSKESLAHPIADPLSHKTYYPVSSNAVFEVQQRRGPSVMAVLPLMDSRNMALQSSSQQQIEVALALSAAFAAKGMNGAANLLSDYVKRQESNINTRNSLPVTTTYSDGQSFGFQIYPSAQALENPGKSGGGSGNILQPVTFPIVVAIKVDRDSVVKGESNQNNPWDYLVTEAQTRWIPVKWGMQPMLERWFSINGREIGNDVPLFEAMRRARKIDKATEKLRLIAPFGAQYPSTIPPQYRFQFQQLEVTMDSLTSSALSYQVARPLPTDLFASNAPAPAISEVYPHSIWRDANTEFTLLVKGVTDPAEVDKVIIAGTECSAIKAISFGTNTTNTTDKTPKFVSQGIAISATLASAFYAVTNNATNNVDFVVLFKDHAMSPAMKTFPLTLQGKMAPEAMATISRDSNGKFLGVDIKPGQHVSEGQLLDALKAVLQNSESPLKTSVIVP